MSPKVFGNKIKKSINLINFAVACILGFYSHVGFCANPKVVSNSKFEEPYGMAGCGLWSKVITSKNRDAQLGVSVLRMAPYVGFVDSQTSGITSGTSNCVASRSQFAAVEGETYVRININSLSKETSQGSGQHLDALAEILGCPYETFAHMSQSRYDAIFKEAEPKKVFQNYIDMARSDKALSDQCMRLS